jgi:hypothetical protein
LAKVISIAVFFFVGSRWLRIKLQPVGSYVEVSLVIDLNAAVNQHMADFGDVFGHCLLLFAKDGHKKKGDLVFDVADP